MPGKKPAPAPSGPVFTINGQGFNSFEEAREAIREIWTAHKAQIAAAAEEGED